MDKPLEYDFKIPYVKLNNETSNDFLRQFSISLHKSGYTLEDICFITLQIFSVTSFSICGGMVDFSSFMKNLEDVLRDDWANLSEHIQVMQQKVKNDPEMRRKLDEFKKEIRGERNYKEKK